ncbi:MAG: family 20 glycosylhydrolase, partial [Alistipes sp.]|nr:family 20 glycosylhydrolase [Alistipes sp.]
MKRILTIMASGLMLLQGCTTADERPLLRWRVTRDESGWHHSMTLVNRSRETLDSEWTIYYGSLGPQLRATEGSPVGAGMIRGSHHRIYSTESFAPLAPGDSVHFTLEGGFVDMQSFYPEGAYIVCTDGDGREDMSHDVELVFEPYHDRRAQAADTSYPTAERIYALNERLASDIRPGAYDILPSLKSVRPTGGACTIGRCVALDADPALADEAAQLEELLRNCCDRTTDKNGTRIELVLRGDDTRQGAYRMEFTQAGVRLSAATPLGINYAARSLVAILSGLPRKAVLPAAVIEDCPDMRHRGIMFDIARNFTPKEEIYRLIDLLSLYKMNVLHLHLSDDEGWRLEIPGLEELTEVGARRGHTLAEQEFLAPLYGSGRNADAGAPGSGFLTRDEFIGILRYAAARHIDIIPEIDVPGHSRAAIKAMNARYARYAATDPERAAEYLLTDPDDRSVYRSAQDYSDNVIDIGMESSYAFVRKVIGEIRAMYAEAGAALTAFHIGGDEVPRGAWQGSPSSLSFMERNGLADVHQLKNHFVRWLYDELGAHGIRLTGWQEIVMLPDGKSVDTELPGRNILSYAWSTMPEYGRDEIPYALANAGYPVILANVTNLYLDLAYDKHWMERGHRWGGYIDIVSTFDVVPYDIYKSRGRGARPRGGGAAGGAGAARA